ncbi:MAG TPA: hypothetical protein PK076_01970 [Saprospiraceae bacterium]|nr:hypothetical protein [Saprospiraceae bacterium]
MKYLDYLIAFSMVLLLSSCDKEHKNFKGHLPEVPVNLTEFNTQYDDYNSASPVIGKLIPFCFSTNRDSKGGQFDVIFLPMDISFELSTGILKVSNSLGGWEEHSKEFNIITSGINKIKTAGNELGPNLIIDTLFNHLDFTILYSSDISGNAQIKFVLNHNDSIFSDPKDIRFLNSEFDDMYPTFTADKSTIYFCSNREGGSFDFYYVNVNPSLRMEKLLSADTSYQVVKDSNLSSNFDDKCPFIYGNKMVFTSNRAGGFGGYDLYYSNFKNGHWSAPINFGPSINSEFDEYRPILLEEGVSWTQHMMVFSSNRPGGLGGFDLYFVGIPGK